MTWRERDLPVLRAIVEMTDEGQWVITPQQVAERTGLEVETVALSFNALASESPPFFEFRDHTAMGGERRDIGHVLNPTGHARRAVDVWPPVEPTAERLADQIVAGLLAAAAAEEDEEKRGRIRKTATWLGGAGRDVLLGVAGNAISGGLGL